MAVRKVFFGKNYFLIQLHNISHYIYIFVDNSENRLYTTRSLSRTAIRLPNHQNARDLSKWLDLASRRGPLYAQLTYGHIQRGLELLLQLPGRESIRDASLNGLEARQLVSMVLAWQVSRSDILMSMTEPVGLLHVF